MSSTFWTHRRFMGMLGFLAFLGGSTLGVNGFTPGNVARMILGGMVLLSSVVLIAYANDTHQNRVIDRLRGGREEGLLDG